jgi:hypothetical protein
MLKPIRTSVNQPPLPRPPRTPDSRPITRCSVGHSYFGSNLVCPFCEDFLSEFRRIAADRNADLQSTNQSKYLSFLCRKHKEPFVLTVSEVRLGDRWCPTCKTKLFRECSPRPRELPKRVVDPAKEQAELLNSAREKYNKLKDKKVDMVKLYADARNTCPPDFSLKHALIVTAAASEADGQSYWSQLGAVLDTPGSTIEQIYRATARRVHPDKCKHPKADDAFKRLASEFRKFNKR